MSMSINLGMVTYGLDRKSTGIARHTSETIAIIRENPDINLTLLTSGGLGALAGANPSTIPLPGCTLAPMLLSLGQLEIAYFSRRTPFDILHDMSAMTPFALASSRSKQVVTVHDVIPLSYPGYSTNWDSLVYRYWLPYIVPKMDAILTVSETSRQDIAKFYHYPIERIYNVGNGKNPMFQVQSDETVETCKRKYSLPQKYILFVGSLLTRKNLSRLLKAFELCKQAGLEHKLVLVGPQKGKNAEVMEHFRNSELMDSEIIFTGFVDSADLPAIYAGAEVFVYPSLYEGFGLPVIEAMACGTPVITSNASSLPDVAGNAALLIDPNSVDDLKNAISRICSDAALRASMIKAGFQQASKFTWAETAEKTTRVYEAVLA